MTSHFYLRVKASGLPNYRLIRTPNSCAQISVDGGHIFVTKAIRGPDPEWDERFEISLTQSSIITVQLFHVRSPSNLSLRGTSLISVGDSLAQGDETIVIKDKLKHVGLKYGKMASFVVSLSRRSAQESSFAPVETVGPVSTAVIKRAPHHAEPPEKAKDEIVAEVDRAGAAVTKLKGYDGKVVDNVTAVTSSELFSTVLGYVEKFVEFGDVISQVHPYALLAWNVLTAAHKALQGQSIRDEKIKNLLSSIRDMLEFVEEANAISKISKLQSTVSSMMEEIRKCALFIQEYGRQGLGLRIIRDNFSTTTDHRINEFIATFNDLKENFDRGIIVETFNLLEDVYTTGNEKILENLPGWDLVGIKFKESNSCLSGTRQQLLNEIHAWVHSRDQKCILWLSGGAGTGKTSVANSIAASLDAFGCLGACFFFNRDISSLNDPNYLFGNICYQLAHFDARGKFRIKSTVMSTIRSMGYVASSSLQTQARKLIVDTMNEATFVGPIVIVIDALDESRITHSRRDLLAGIAAEMPKLPRSVKVMITSRDEPDIRASLQDCSQEICIDHTEKTAEDIACYIKHRLASIQRRSHLRDDWPGLGKINELVNRAGNLFIWASVACNFVEEKRNPTWRLSVLMNATSSVEGAISQPLKKLDILYNTILRNAFPDEDDLLADFRYIIGTIAVLETPLTQTSMDSLLGLGDSSGKDLSLPHNGHEMQLSSSNEILSLLGSIVRADRTDTTGKDGPLRLLHPSLYDFLTSRAEGYFRIKPLQQHEILAIRCLTTLNSQLQFDICKIGNPSLLNEEIEDLSSRVDEYVPEELRYACRSLVYHLAQVSAPDTALMEALTEFVSEHLLHWMEALSLLGEVSKAENWLHVFANWINDHKYDNIGIKSVVEDAISFLMNCGQAVRLSALHTYFSALSLTPKTANLFKCFIDDIPRVPSITSSHRTWATTSMRVLEGHTSTVWHVVFSPSGKKLATASENTVRLWEVDSGQAIGKPLEGHTSWVKHVAFSPNGRKLASASFDMTVRLWDIENSRSFGRVLQGHTDRVNHVEFSPGGRKLVSAADDMTVRLWDVESGRAIGEALKSHTGSVKHVVFSPNGRELASASSDMTVRLWDLESIPSMRCVLEGHIDSVNYVIFSPDGKKIASAADDKMVRLWDLKNSPVIGHSLEGHTGGVRHVAFSPRGDKLASASSDTTVRLWDTDSGHLIGQALQGHTSEVRHVVFSPDGEKLASASFDMTVRLWDVDSGQCIGQALKGHTSGVWNVAFSPDGEKLASASSDMTARLWGIKSFQAIGQTLEGHTSSVRHIVFSPDGKTLASASSDTTVRLWDVQSGQAVGKALKGHASSVRHVMFSANGKKLASASYDQTLRLWDVESCRPICQALKGHMDSVNYVSFSPNGEKLASAASDLTVRLWDVQTGQAVGQELKGHTSWVTQVIFSPDGRKLASASYDQTVRLWDIDGGQALQTLAGHSSRLRDIVFSPDGKLLASAADDTTVRLWDIGNGQAIVQPLDGHTSGVWDVVFSSDGKTLASVSSDKTVIFWDLGSGKTIKDPRKRHTYVGCQSGQLPPAVTNEAWLHSFITFPNSDSQDTVKLRSSEADKLMAITMSFDELGFLQNGGTRLMWLPSVLRGNIFAAWAQSLLIAVGGRSGAITIIRWPRI